MTSLLVGACALLGLAVGWFLNVVIERVPRRQSAMPPWSTCPSCRGTIAGRDNLPVISWFLLRGRCRACGEPISPRYPLVELLCAVLFTGAGLRFGYDPALPALLVFLAGLLALAFTDLERFLLPVRIVYPVLGLLIALLGMAAAVSGTWGRFAVAVATSVAAFAIFFALNLANPEWMAFGDVRLALVMGLGLGWLGAGIALLGFFLAFLLGSVVGVGLLVAKKIRRQSSIPFGVFMAAGAFLAIYFGTPLIDLYMEH